MDPLSGICTHSQHYPLSIVHESHYNWLKVQCPLQTTHGSFTVIYQCSFNVSAIITRVSTCMHVTTTNACLTSIYVNFRYFYQGAVDIFNTPTVEVTDCTFEHNGPVSVFKPDPYRGHSGGLSIGYGSSNMQSEGSLKVTHCTFRNNTSSPQVSLEESSTRIFQRFIFTGRGGGCALTINTTFPLNITVEDCLFEDNSAQARGGGLYLAFTGFSQHVTIVNRVTFVRNKTPGTGGGLLYGSVDGTSTITLLAKNLTFIENEARDGGGMLIFVLNGGEMRLKAL